VANGDYTYNVLAGNYNFGATTVYAGYTTTKSNGAVTAIEDATSYNVAAKYVMGQIDLLGNYTVRTSNIAGVNNASVLGLGANYNLSKRTSVYYRYEQANSNTNDQAATAGGSVTNTSMVGVRHAF
jgi:predicted porin